MFIIILTMGTEGHSQEDRKMISWAAICCSWWPNACWISQSLSVWKSKMIFYLTFSFFIDFFSFFHFLFHFCFAFTTQCHLHSKDYWPYWRVKGCLLSQLVAITRHRDKWLIFRSLSMLLSDHFIKNRNIYLVSWE